MKIDAHARLRDTWLTVYGSRLESAAILWPLSRSTVGRGFTLLRSMANFC